MNVSIKDTEASLHYSTSTLGPPEDNTFHIGA